MILETALGLAGLTAAYFAGRYIYDDVYLRIMTNKRDRVRLDAMRQQAALKALRRFEPDPNGRGGWVVTADAQALRPAHRSAVC